MVVDNTRHSEVSGSRGERSGEERRREEREKDGEERASERLTKLFASPLCNESH